MIFALEVTDGGGNKLGGTREEAACASPTAVEPREGIVVAARVFSLLPRQARVVIITTNPRASAQCRLCWKRAGARLKLSSTVESCVSGG